MKRILLAFGIVLLLATQSFAAWTLTPSWVSKYGHYVQWKVICTSDGDALAKTDLVALMPAGLKAVAQGSTMMILKVSPGLTTVAPDNTFTVTLSDAQGAAVFTQTAVSNTADTTGLSLAKDFNQYPTVSSAFYLTLTDIGTAGDQVTLYFECWVEDKY